MDLSASPSARRYAWVFLVIICLLHFFLAIFYARVTPYRQAGFTQGKWLLDIGAPDERAHANLVEKMLRGEPYPVLEKDDPSLSENYQAHQPPLYYVTTAAWLRLTGFSTITSQDGGRAARLLNCLIGTWATLGVFVLVTSMGRRVRTALTASLVFGLVPMNLALSGSVNNDSLLICFCTWSLAFLFRAKHRGWRLAEGVCCAVLIGLACLTKSTGLLLLPTALVYCLLHVKANENRLKVMSLLTVVIVPVLIVSPWWLRNTQVYGEPLVTERFSQTFRPDFGESRFRSRLSTYLWARQLGEYTVESATGVFGYFDIHYRNLKVPAVLAWVVLIMATIGALAAWWAGYQREVVAGLIFFGLVLAAYIKFNTIYAQPQARYLFPGLGVIAWLVAEGLGKFHPRIIGLWLLVYLPLNVTTLGMLQNEYGRRINGP
ncbi:glycosyltransferase family 39 protein [Kamptonema cortianum]|nr:glycosyltransferase family 39 protein [Geitlerinema splendidum]MDK3156225.1 glycosyltransferase family 39 protein [Kamptonema cortianum]